MPKKPSNATVVIDTTKEEAASTAVRQLFHTLSPEVALTLVEARAVSGRSRSSLYRHFEAGELTRVKIGNSTRVRVSELRRLLGL